MHHWMTDAALGLIWLLVILFGLGLIALRLQTG